MAALTDRIASASPALLWLDDTAYSARLFGGGRTPWLDPAALISLRRKAVGLLRPTVCTAPLDAIIRSWLDHDSGLRAAMQAKKRAVAPLRTLLADEALRARLIEIVTALRATFRGTPFILTLPSPRRWVVEAFHLAHGPDAPVEVGGPEIDAGAMYVAEFLRSFGGLGVDGLLLQEAGGNAPDDCVQSDWYRPVINLCAHYRWDLGMQLPAGHGFSSAPAQFAFVISPWPVPGVTTGIDTPDEFWSGEPPPPAPSGAFRFARIPVEGRPEQVLERLQLLRGN